MARRLIGTGTTDANGKVSVSYEGKGAGKLQLVAESGSLLSEIYSLYDCMLFDESTTEHHKSIWRPFAGEISYSENGTTWTSTTSSQQSYALLVNEGTTTYTTPDIPVNIEFDLVSYNGNCFIDVNSNNGNRTRINFHVGGTGHYRFEIGSTLRKAYKDGVDVSSTTGLIHTPTVELEDIKQIGFFLTASATDLTFKNFMIY